MGVASAPSLDEIRDRFPALGGEWAFFENAGGSQVPRDVIDSMGAFMRESYVQTGVGYPASERATALVGEARGFLADVFGCDGSGSVVMGMSTTCLMAMLGECYRKKLKAGDEVIVSVANHESHAGPWARLEDEGITVKWWGVDRETGLSSLVDLAELLGDRTKLVCCTRTCNLLGDQLDVKSVAAMAHRVGAQVVADCVASAPHEVCDVVDWDLDFCVFSLYKVYGPHLAAVWGKNEAWGALQGPNHFFMPDEGGKKFELGCLPYELLAGVLGLRDYYGFLAGGEDSVGRGEIGRAYSVMAEQEAKIDGVLGDFLRDRDDVRLLGPQEPGEGRHPTYGFLPLKKGVREVVDGVLAKKIAIRDGHMYAWRCCEAMGISTDTGIVRISAVHTNTIEEAERVVSVLVRVLDS